MLRFIFSLLNVLELGKYLELFLYYEEVSTPVKILRISGLSNRIIAKEN